MRLLFIFLILLKNDPAEKVFFLPINNADNKTIRLTDIGSFGLLRSARPDVPAHLHTGIDIRRPSDNYSNALIYPITRGKVISKRDDGPYAQLIIEHTMHGKKLWTVYEHIAGIFVSSGDSLSPDMPFARFMNREELNRYGWQFDHFHFEILKIKPVILETDTRLPERHFNSYTLRINNYKDLEKYFYDPIVFFKQYVN